MSPLVLRLAQGIRSGTEMGVLVPRLGGGLSHVVLSSAELPSRPAARVRGVVIEALGAAVVLYSTVHCDSGVLLAAEGSPNVTLVQ